MGCVQALGRGGLYVHGTVVHSKKFMSKEGVSTNTIEGKNSVFGCPDMEFELLI